MIDFNALTIDLLYMLAYSLGEVAVFIGGAGLVAGSFFAALTIMTVGLVRGRVA